MSPGLNRTIRKNISNIIKCSSNCYRINHNPITFIKIKGEMYWQLVRQVFDLKVKSNETTELITI